MPGCDGVDWPRTNGHNWLHLSLNCDRSDGHNWPHPLVSGPPVGRLSDRLTTSAISDRRT